MKILLINPPIREWAPPNCFPSGLGYVARALLDAGHSVEVLDINAHRPDRSYVESVVEQSGGIDLFAIGGIITTYAYIKWLSSTIKRAHPTKKIVVGGAVASSIPSMLLSRTDVDLVVSGEGEKSCVDLVYCLEQGYDLNGEVGYDEPLDIKTLPFPAWDLFPMDVYAKNPIGAVNRRKWLDGKMVKDSADLTLPPVDLHDSAVSDGACPAVNLDGGENPLPLSINVSASRGCPYSCTYCYHDFMGKKYRRRDAANIFEEVLALHYKYGIGYVHFIDDTFVGDRRNVLEFCGLMERSGLDVKWGSTGRIGLMSEELIERMAAAGCVFVTYGIESGSQAMLDVMNKRCTVEQARETLLWTKKYIPDISNTYIVGMPGETRETAMETVRFCNELEMPPEAIFFATPYPGTRLYEQALERNLIGDTEKYIESLWEQGENIAVNFTDMTNNELFALREEMIEMTGATNAVRHEKERFNHRGTEYREKRRRETKNGEYGR